MAVNPKSNIFYNTEARKLLNWTEDDSKEYIKSKLNFDKEKDFNYNGCPFDMPPEYEKILLKDKRYFTLVYGGRGGAKSKAFMIALFDASFDAVYKDKIFLCIREIKSSNDESIRSELIQLINNSPRQYRKCFYIPKNGAIRNLKTGVSFVFIGLKDLTGEKTSVDSRFNNLAKVKSTNSIGIIFLEEASAYTMEALTTLINTPRPNTVFLKPEYMDDDGIDLEAQKDPLIRDIILKQRVERRTRLNDDDGSIRIFAAMNPKLQVDPILRMSFTIDDDRKHVRKINITDLPSAYQSKKLLQNREEQRGNKDWDHIWNGTPKVLGGGKLFYKDWIIRADEIFKNSIKFERVAIAIDPALSAKKGSNETGIVIVGLYDEHYYILADKSGRYSSKQWSDLAIDLYMRYNCTEIIIETNVGGDALIELLNQAGENSNPTIYPKIVSTRANAGNSKHVRAEPIAALYENQKVIHIGEFVELEDQLDGFTTTGYIGQYDSPDRADALIWGLHILHYERKNNEIQVIGCV